MLSLSLDQFILWNCEPAADELGIIGSYPVFRDKPVVPEVVGLDDSIGIGHSDFELSACKALDRRTIETLGIKGTTVMITVTFYYNSLVI